MRGHSAPLRPQARFEGLDPLHQFGADVGIRDRLERHTYMNTRNQWEKNAPAWTELARRGRDVYRDSFNTPAFLAALPDVRNLRGLDLGCGEGHNTRLVAGLGPELLVGLDHSIGFVQAARQSGGCFVSGDGAALPFPPDSFDFVTAFMSVMDMPDTARVLDEVARVLRPGGFFQFSISHPCFFPPHRRNLRDGSGRTYAIEVGRYFEEGLRTDVWLFSAASPEEQAAHAPFEISSVHRTLSSWLNLLIAAGFVLEYVGEPRPSTEATAHEPRVADAQVVSYFLHLRARLLGSKR